MIKFKKIVVGIIIVILFLLVGCDKKIETSTITTTRTTENINNEESFVLAVLPDTQRYAKNDPTIFYSQTNWIADNYVKYNIKFTIHLGDIVQNSENRSQWEVANKAFKILDDAHIPYGVTAGNNDVVEDKAEMYTYRDNERPKYLFFLHYFTKSRAAKFTDNYGGHDESGWNSYYYFEAVGQKYLVLFYDFAASKETIDWANNILKLNKDIPTIFITHILSQPLGKEGESHLSCDECKETWDNIITKNDQIFLAINGHKNGSGYELKQNKFGNDVLLMVVNYQNEYRGGNGWMRLVEFNVKNNTITASSFSPYVLSISEEKRTSEDIVELIDKANKYTISFNFNERFNFNIYK